MEFLEHVEEDLMVLDRIRAGTYVLATVPNFPADGHVRHFQDEAQVKARYEALISSIRVDAILEDTNGKTFFLLEGEAIGGATSN